MQDNITFIAIPSFLIFTANWKVDLCFTLPVTLACMNYTISSAFDTANDNMVCYIGAEKIASTQFMRTTLLLFVMLYSIHDYQKTEIKSFIAKERDMKQ